MNPQIKQLFFPHRLLDELWNSLRSGDPGKGEERLVLETDLPRVRQRLQDAHLRPQVEPLRGDPQCLGYPATGKSWTLTVSDQDTNVFNTYVLKCFLLFRKSPSHDVLKTTLGCWIGCHVFFLTAAFQTVTFQTQFSRPPRFQTVQLSRLSIFPTIVMISTFPDLESRFSRLSWIYYFKL